MQQIPGKLKLIWDDGCQWQGWVKFVSLEVSRCFPVYTRKRTPIRRVNEYAHSSAGASRRALGSYLIGNAREALSFTKHDQHFENAGRRRAAGERCP